MIATTHLPFAKSRLNTILSTIENVYFNYVSINNIRLIIPFSIDTPDVKKGKYDKNKFLIQIEFQLLLFVVCLLLQIRSSDQIWGMQISANFINMLFLCEKNVCAWCNFIFRKFSLFFCMNVWKNLTWVAAIVFLIYF